jgi:hypothetical protein
MRMFGEIGPEVVPVAAWVVGVAGDNAVQEFDERQLSAAASHIQCSALPVCQSPQLSSQSP